MVPGHSSTGLGVATCLVNCGWPMMARAAWPVLKSASNTAAALNAKRTIHFICSRNALVGTKPQLYQGLFLRRAEGCPAACAFTPDNRPDITIFIVYKG